MAPGETQTTGTPSVEDELEQYRALSRAAILGLALGPLSLFALVGWLLVIIPILAVVLCVIALRNIEASEGALVGRPLAFAGLSLALIFGGAAVSYRVAYRQLLIRDGRQVAELWFRLLQDDQPHRAHQLILDANLRLSPDVNIWEMYRKNSRLHDGLEKFVEDRVVRTLLALGVRAEIRYYGTEVIDYRDRRDMIVQVYAVTFEQDGERTTFFVRVVLERKTNHRTTRDAWVVYNHNGGIRPFQAVQGGAP